MLRAGLIFCARSGVQKKDDRSMSSNTKKGPAAAQVAAAKKAAGLKAANAAKKPQPLWLQQQGALPAYVETQPPQPERISAAHLSQGPPRLLSKSEVCVIANVSFPTLWS